jgi:hypothetical protein
VKSFIGGEKIFGKRNIDKDLRDEHMNIKYGFLDYSLAKKPSR